MKFQVPQFIDVEDKVFGPFTFKQFVYIAGGVGLSFVLLKLLPRFLAILLIIPVALFSAALAFYRMNNKPFVQMVESFFKYLFAPRLYLWRHKPREPLAEKPMAAEDYAHIELPKIQDSKLKHLTWSLDAKGGKEE